MSEYSRAEEAAHLITSRTKLHPRIAVVLGSGLGAFVERLAEDLALPYSEIPGFPQLTAVGHAGKLIVGRIASIPLVVLQGRAHFYDGHTLKDVIFPTRTLGTMGVRALLLTNAAGGINPEYRPGMLVALRDHINLLGSSPLIGPNDERLGPRYPDMSDAYDVPFRRLAAEEAAKLGFSLPQGVYAAVPGPQYETPAEIGFLRAIGADMVGMSTVPEAIAARHMGMRVLALSCIANLAAGLSPKKVDHEEVLEVGRNVASRLAALLEAILPRIHDAIA